jgi:hypothetical protein
VAPILEMPRRDARQQDRRFTYLLPHTCRLGAQQQGKSLSRSFKKPRCNEKKKKKMIEA